MSILKNLLPLVLSGVATAAYATDGMTLEVNYIDGTTAEVTMSSNPVLTFEGDNFCIDGHEISMSVPFNTVSNIAFKNVPSSGVSAPTVQPDYILTPDSFSYDFGPQGGDILLYDTAGILVSTAHCASGTGMLSLGTVAPGIYIIKADALTLKIRLNE